MAALDRVFGALGLGTNGPGSGPDPQPGSDMVGHTAPLPDPGTVRPRVGATPIGQSGRANFYGLPEWDEINPKLIGTRGMRLYDEMYRSDAHLRRLILAAWCPLVAGTWMLEPYGGDEATDLDREVADTIWWMLTEWMRPNFYEHLYELGPVLLRSGFTPFEEMWRAVSYQGKTFLGPKKLDMRLPRTVWKWWQDDFGDLTHIGQLLPSRADVVISADDMTYYRIGAEGDNWMGTSLLRHAYKNWYLKDKLERLDAIGQERRAVGVPVVYHSPDVDGGILDQLEGALASMHMSEVAYLMIPGWKMGESPPDASPSNHFLVDVVQYDSSAGPGIQASIDYHQTAISASFLEDFLELGHHQVGARATAEVQEDPFLTAINGALLPPVIPPLNRLIDKIRRLNWDKAQGSPTLSLTLNDEASLSEIQAFVTPLIQQGAIQVDPDLEDWLRERAGMPAANAEVRQEREQARQAGMEAAANAATATPAADGASTAPADGDGQTPALPQATTTKAAGEPGGADDQADDQPTKPSAGKQLDDDRHLSKAERRKQALAELATENDRRLAEIDAEMAQLEADSAPRAAGIIVRAGDTGHVLTVQRTPDDTDRPGVFARSEFPGGKLDPDDPSSFQGARREFGEELGTDLPRNFTRLGSFHSPDGAYEAHIVEIPAQTDLQVAHGDKTEIASTDWVHPDNLDADATRLSPRAQRLVPGLRATLGRTRPNTPATAGHHLDDAGTGFVPLSGGTTTGDGLQMVPETGGSSAKTCTCGVGPWNTNGVCAACGGTDPAKAIPTTLDNAMPTAKWFEQLLSHDQLRQAFDGARDHIQTSCSGPVLTIARQMANQASNTALPGQIAPPPQLIDALEQHYRQLYQLGRDTVATELARQHARLRTAGVTLDDTPDDRDAASGPIFERLGRARQRAEHSARNIVSKIREVIGRDQITSLKDPMTVQQRAEKAATGQLRLEALNNTAASINDGRADEALSNPVVGAYYTSVMDERSCDPCVAADDGSLLSPEDAIGYGPPNPQCEGGDFCRCVLVWVLSDDPAALTGV